MMPSIASTDTRRWCYISLVFSLFYFMPTVVLFNDVTLLAVASHCLLYAVFIGLYLTATFLPSHNIYIVLVLLIVVLFAGTSLTMGTSSLFGYILFLSSFYLGLKRALLFGGLVIMAIIVSGGLYHGFSVYFVAPALGVAIGIGLYGRLSRAEYLHRCIQKEQHAQIKSLATLAERERIARDLHDLLGHSLSIIAIKAELSEKMVHHRHYDKAMIELHDLAALARSSLSEVRYAVTDIKQKNVLSTVQQICLQLERIGFTVEENISNINVSSAVESTCIMLIKEWGTNILRHSNADTAYIALTQSKNILRITVQTNEKLPFLNEGNGIKGMRERVSYLGGSMVITLDPKLCLNIHIPVLA